MNGPPLSASNRATVMFRERGFRLIRAASAFRNFALRFRHFDKLIKRWHPPFALSHAVKKLALFQQIYYRVYAGIAPANGAAHKVTEVKWRRAPGLRLTINYEMVRLSYGSRNLKLISSQRMVARVVERSLWHRIGGIESAALLSISVFQPNPVPSTSYFTPGCPALTKLVMYVGDMSW